MKKAIAIAALFLSFIAGAFAARVQDWRDLEAVHKQVQHAIHEMERARAANHYDMAGHGAKAEEHLAALSDICLIPCEEYDDLKEKIEEYKRAEKGRQ